MRFPQRNPESRSTYRVAIDGADAKLWIGLKSGPAEAQFDDISARGCGFGLPAEKAAGLEVGSEVVLRMRVGGAHAPQLFVRGEIRAVRKKGSAVHFGVRFNDCDRLYGQLNEVQWRFFNRREAFRVPPVGPRGRPLRARLFTSDDDSGKMFTVNDLSSTGMSILLRDGDPYPFDHADLIGAEFELPGVENPFSLRLEFVHRTLVQGRERIGYRIDTAATPDAAIQSEAILKYAFERQSQILRSS